MPMDEADIQAELSDLRSSTSASDRKVGDLDDKVSGIDHKVSDLDRQVGGIGDTVALLANTIAPAIKKLQSDFNKLAEELRLNRVKDEARDNRDDLDRELKEQFGPHKEVRKLAANIIRIVGTGVIDDKVLLHAAQQRMVDLPDYWLAPAVVAVAAWLSGNEVKCSEALDLATRLDRSKTALFMALLLRHHDRGQALQRWIDAYLAGLQPRNLPADFQVVIDAVASGALGAGSAPKLADWMSAQYLAETRSRHAQAEATREWQQRLRSMTTMGDFAPTLAKSSPDWATLRDRHHVNVAIEVAERHFRGRFEAGADAPAGLTERMRELVAKLARTPDPEEEKLLRHRRLEDAVSRTGDRQDAHRRLAAEDAGRTGSLNLLSLVSASAFPVSPGGKMPVPTVTELLTIVLSNELIANAIGSLHDGTVRPANITVRVGRSPERACEFSCGSELVVTRQALEKQAAAMEAAILDQIRQETDDQQYRLRKFVKRPLPAMLSSSAVVAAVPHVVRTGIPAIDFTIPAAVVTAGAGWWLIHLLQRLRNVRSTSAREMSAISTALKDAAAELARFFAQDQDSAVLRNKLQQFLRKLTPDDADRAVRHIQSPQLPRPRDFPEWTPLPPEGHSGIDSVDRPHPLP
jgi:hypothetical protein